MDWDDRLLKLPSAKPDLRSALTRLFDGQRAAWAQFRDGELALASVQTRPLWQDGVGIVVQANPGRRRSTHAKTDPQSVASRRCFLCSEHMPPAERGIAWGSFGILPNPYPILPDHCTIPHRLHRPQQIEGQVGVLLALAAACGPTMVVFYNGPRCGASAPDHLHFQACRAEGIPLLDSLPAAGGTSPLAVESFGRKMLVCADPDPSVVQASIEQAIAALRQVAGHGDEPLLNLLAWQRGPDLVSVLFPRAAHRPACYFLEGDARLAISPATLEMAGILVLAEPDQLDQVDAAAARRIYAEVSLDAERFAALVEATCTA